MRRAFVIVGWLVGLPILAATQSQYISGNLTVGGSLKDTAGVSYIKDAPNDANTYGRSGAAWVTISGGGGISDAPSDGNPYGRKDAGWVDLYGIFAEVAHGHAISGITGLSDAITARSLVGHTHDWADITGEPTFALDGHEHDTSDITSGVMDPARLGTGTPSSSVFLRGDGAWATAPGGGGGSGITDAPSDGSFYGRLDAGWVNPTASAIVSGVFNVGRLGSGTSSSSKFLRGGASSGSWDTLVVADITDITDWGAGLVGAIDPAAGRAELELGDSATLDVGTGSGDVAAGDHSHAFAAITATPTTLAGYGITDGVPTSRTVTGAKSITGGGDLTANRTLELDGDETTPAGSKYYGTDGAGNRGFHSLAGSHTHPDLANARTVAISEVTDTNEDTTFRSVLGSIGSGYSATLGAGSLPSGSVLKIEAAGRFEADANFAHVVRLKIGSSLTLEFVCNEPASGAAPSGTPWNLTAWVTVTTAGASATVTSTAWMEYHTDESVGSATDASYSFRTRGTRTGTLDTTAANAVDLTYSGQSTTATSFTCSHLVLQQF